MKKNYRIYHLLQLIETWNFKIALDVHIDRYFRAHRALGAKDRKEIASIFYGIIRWQGLLDNLIPGEKNWEKRIEFYRQIDPLTYQQNTDIPLYQRVSCPDSLFSLLTKQYGSLAQSIALANNTQAPTTIRINPSKISREELFQKWAPLYSIQLSPLSPLGITFLKKISLFSLEEFKRGWFEVQDEGSQLISLLMNPKPGDLVLDYCAGAGGKTLAFAHLLKGQGQIFLHDVRLSALIEARKRLKRSGNQNFQIVHSQNPYLKKLKRKMDWVFVDAPCSGTGTLRRNPDMKWRFSLPFLQELQAQQRVIFERALSFLKPRGKIIYATCSILKEENEEQMEHFLKTYPIKLVSSPLAFIPKENEKDGFFGVVFEKISQKETF